MITQLTPYYSRRQSVIYRLAHLLQNHFRLLILLSIVSILIYPSGKYGYFYYQQAHKQAEISRLSETVANQQAHLATRIPSGTTPSQEENLTDLNQQIQHLFNQHQIPIERLQWQFNGRKTLQLTANATTTQILTLIEALNKLPTLYFNEIHLLKLNYEQKIQLQATLIPVSPSLHPTNEEVP